MRRGVVRRVVVKGGRGLRRVGLPPRRQKTGTYRGGSFKIKHKMSLYEDLMLCNVKTCRNKISAYAWATSCSHLFCDEDGTKAFRESLTCPACNTAVSGKGDVIRFEVNPAEEYKSMVLCGLKPDIILEICSRALSFWTSQIHQENLFQEYAMNKTKTEISRVEKNYKQEIQYKTMEISTLQYEMSIVKQELKKYKTQYNDTTEMLLRKNRETQKLQAMCEHQRIHNSALANQQKMAASEIPMEFISSFTMPLKTADDILRNRPNVSQQRQERSGNFMAFGPPGLNTFT